jgi:hypothetical protein
MSEKQTRAEGCRVRAVELRMIAEVVKGPENRAGLLKIADYYEHMADQIERTGLL